MRTGIILGLCCILSAFAMGLEVDIYSDYAIIKDNWPEKIGEGTKVVQWQLPENIDLNSFVILSPEIEVLSRIEEKSSQLEGRLVHVFVSGGRLYKGILKSLGEELVLVDSENGNLVAIINKDHVTSIIPQEKVNFTKKLKLELLNQNKQELENLQVRYIASGISWNVIYSLELNDKKATLVGEYQIDNKTTNSYKDASVRLIAKTEPNYYPYGLRNEMALSTKGSFDMIQEPQMTQRAETAVYEIPRKIDIPSEARLRLDLLKEEDLKVERSYIMDDNRINVEIELSGIKQPLPQGEISIFDEGILASKQFLSSKPQSGKLKLNLGETLDIAGLRESLRHYKKGLNLVDEYRVTLKNNKEEEVTVQVKAFLPRSNSEVESKMPYRRISSNIVIFDVVVGSKEEVVFDYAVFYPEK